MPRSVCNLVTPCIGKRQLASRCGDLREAMDGFGRTPLAVEIGMSGIIVLDGATAATRSGASAA